MGQGKQCTQRLLNKLRCMRFAQVGGARIRIRQEVGEPLAAPFGQHVALRVAIALEPTLEL